MDISKRIYGGMLGLIIGDALGVPYEFKGPEEIPALNQLSYKIPKGMKKTYPDVLPATWSDDSAQALCLMESLIEKEGFDLMDFSARLLAWYNQGLWAVEGRVFDCGIQTSEALHAFAGKRPPAVWPGPIMV